MQARPETLARPSRRTVSMLVAALDPWAPVSPIRH